MPFVPTRFIHANHLRLDHQPRGVGDASTESQALLEDCTLITFDNVVKACVEHGVDFLLLTGNTLIEDDHSIRGNIAFMDGLYQLASKKIPVFIVPGKNDSLSHRKSLFNWPENVTFLSSQDPEIFNVIREEKLITTIQVLEPSQENIEQSLKLNQRNQLFNTQDERALSIGMLPDNLSRESTNQVQEVDHSIPQSLSGQLNELDMDYLALCKGTQPYTFEMQSGFAHHPGTTQELCYDEFENSGVTLVTVKPEEQLNLRPLKLAAVRWINIELSLDSETSREQLKHQMREALFSNKTGALEKLWMVRWQLAGSGELFHSLSDSKYQHELLTEMANEIKDHIPALFEQSLEFQSFVPDATQNQSPLMTRYRHQLEAFQMETNNSLNQLLVDASHLDQTWHQRLDAMKTRMKEQHIFNTAIRNGHDWLNISSDEEIHS